MADYGKPTLIAAFLRDTCYEFCNPGAFKQRLIQGARHSDSEWEKLVAFKRVCTRGCELASLTQNQLDAKEEKDLLALVQEQQVGSRKILDHSGLEAARAVRNRFLEKLRQECYDMCRVEYKGDKQVRMCAEGCDAYFEHLL